MLQDVEARRPTEVDYLNGGIVRFGRRARRADAAQRGDLGARERGGGVVDAELDRAATRACARRWRATGSTPRSSAAPSTPASRAPSRTCPASRSSTATRTSCCRVDGDPAIVFPTEARYVGEHGDSQIEEQVFVDRPGEWLADRLRGKRVGVYGLDYVMTVRDYAPLAAAAELVAWDAEFDLARAVKSDAELESVRESVAINVDGFHAFREAWAPGKTAAEVMAPAEELFVERGCGRLTMNMVLVGAEFAIARDDTVFGEFTRPVARDRRPRRPLGRGLARARHAERRGAADARGVRGVLRGRADGAPRRARPRTTSTARSRRASPSAATTSATSPATRSG